MARHDCVMIVKNLTNFAQELLAYLRRVSPKTRMIDDARHRDRQEQQAGCHKRPQIVLMLFGEVANGSVPFEESKPQQRIVFSIHDLGERDRDVIREEAPAAFVEVDHGQVALSEEEVPDVIVAMDETECISFSPDLRHRLLHRLRSTIQRRRIMGGQNAADPGGIYSGLSSHDEVVVQGLPGKSARAVPVEAMLVDARQELAGAPE